MASRAYLDGPTETSAYDQKGHHNILVTMEWCYKLIRAIILYKIIANTAQNENLDH